MLIIDILIDEQETQKINFISNKILLEDKRINTWDDYKTSSQQQLENQKHVEIQERTQPTLPKACNQLDNKCKKMVFKWVAIQLSITESRIISLPPKSFS
jgi:hypothetical protein